jgi:8-oxo-dGTP pyrophosphatase MutT (NUDIX family)
MFTRFKNLETAQAHAVEYGLRQRVCVYLVRAKDEGQRVKELLVFEHAPEYPTAGIQVPAGGLETGETIKAGALREAFEETGLTDLTFQSYLGSNKHFYGSRKPQIWHFVWLTTTDSRDSWEHLAEEDPEESYTFYHRFEPLENVVLHYDMDAMLPELAQQLGLEIQFLQPNKRPCVICYITRGSEILTFTGHPDGGIGIPAGGIEDFETPLEAAMREILEESGLSLENPIFLGRQEYYFKGNHPENGTPLEFYEDRYYYWFKTLEPRDSWEWVVSDGEGDKGKVFKHSFVRLEQAKIDWDMDEFIGQLKTS